MPINRNALIRYKTIDNCLRNPYREWTLDDLINACSDALYEFEGIEKGISKRTVQMDIQMMRSEKLGYNAPIEVYDNKFYRYSESNFSITNTPLNEQDLSILSGAVGVLQQFKGFSHFAGMSDIVSRLQDHITSIRQQSHKVIDFEKNENLKGLDFLDVIYQAIVGKKVLVVKYRSFKARRTSTFILYPYLLKEYRNRWFLYAVNKHNLTLYNLALDRIHNLRIAEDEPFVENTFFDTTSFFDDLVGVTKSIHSVPQTVRFVADASNAPYIMTKPIHKSQKIIETCADGSTVFEICVVINQELYREFLGFAEGVKVLSPRMFCGFLAKKLRMAAEQYE